MTNGQTRVPYLIRPCRLLPAITLSLIAITVPLTARDHIAGTAGKLRGPSYGFSYGNEKGQVSGESNLSREAILRGPDWTPGTPAPLTGDQAARIAQEMLSYIEIDKESSTWKITEISITALYGTNFRKWYYTVKFQKLVKWNNPDHQAEKPVYGWENRVAVYVSMNGTPGQIEQK